MTSSGTFRTSARELAVAAVVLQQHRETQRSSAPLTGEQRSIFIQQGPELDQLVNVKRGRLHAPQSFPRAYNHPAASVGAGDSTRYQAPLVAESPGGPPFRSISREVVE